MNNENIAEKKDNISDSAQHKSVKIETRDKLKNNHGWSKITENESIKLSQTTWAWSWLHFRSYQVYSEYDERITILIVILSTIVIIPQIVNTQDSDDHVMRIFAVILNIIIATLSGYKQVVGYGARSQQHKECSNQFNRIYESMRRELIMYRADRQHAHEFINYKSQIVDIYVSSAPDISDSIVKEFKKLFPGVSLPDLISENYNFMVIESPDESLTKSSVEIAEKNQIMAEIGQLKKQIHPINLSGLPKYEKPAIPNNLSDDEEDDGLPIQNTNAFNITNKTNFELARLQRF